MCRVPVQLRESVKRRLAAAAEEIFELLERTIAEYEEESERQRTLLEQLLLETRDQSRGQDQCWGTEETKPQCKEEASGSDVITVQLYAESEETAPPSESEDKSDVSVKTEEEETWTQPLSQDQGRQDQGRQGQGRQSQGRQSQGRQSQDPQSQSQSQDPQSQSRDPQSQSRDPQSQSRDPQSQSRDPQSRDPQSRDPQSRDPQSRDPQSRDHLLPADGVHVCVFCNKRYKWSYELKRHARIHTEEAFSCSVCGKRFFRKDHLQTHMNVHTEERPFSCSVCGLCMKTRANLLRHMTKHKSLRQSSAVSLHGPAEGAVPCQDGPAPHSGSKRVPSLSFFCPICTKGFKSSYHLRRHISVHSRQQPSPLSCPICGVTAKRSRDLERHMAKHDTSDSGSPGGAAPAPTDPEKKQTKGRYSCVFCGKGCKSNSDLSRHVRVHTGERPYRCSVCGNRFTRNYHLQSHMKVHSRQSFSCSVCDQAFTTRQRLKEHLKRHDDQEQENTSSLIYCSIE